MAGDGAVRARVCLLFLLVSTVSATTFSAENQALNTPGGQRYTRALGDAWMVRTLQEVHTFLIAALAPSYKQVDHVSFVLIDRINLIAENGNNEIRMGQAWLAQKPAADAAELQFEIKGLMFHELCHSFQNFNGDYGTDEHFRGVIEGIATYMELVAGYGIDPKVRGSDWFTGYHTTAYFFEWIDRSYVTGFVNKLNQRMGQVQWNDDFFVHLTGMTVDALWSQYQASF